MANYGTDLHQRRHLNIVAFRDLLNKVKLFGGFLAEVVVNVGEPCFIVVAPVPVDGAVAIGILCGGKRSALSCQLRARSG